MQTWLQRDAFIGKVKMSNGTELWYKAKKRLIRVRYDYDYDCYVTDYQTHIAMLATVFKGIHIAIHLHYSIFTYLHSYIYVKILIY